MRKLFIFIMVFPIFIYANIGREFVASNENINLNLFSLYNIEYRSVILNYNHYYDNSGDMDLSLVLPSEWNGTFGLNLYIYDYPSLSVFASGTPQTNIDYGSNLNYSNMLFNSNIGVALNINTDKSLRNTEISPGISFLLGNRYDRYTHLFLSPSYNFYGRNVSITGGIYSQYGGFLTVQGVVRIPVDYVSSIMADCAVRVKLPLSIVLGWECEYYEEKLFSSAKAGFSFDHFGVFGGMKYNGLSLENYFVELVLVTRFGGIVKF